MHILAVLMLLPILLFAQSTMKVPVLYGEIEEQKLLVPPYKEWYSTNFEAYIPGEKEVRALKEISFKNITIEIFMGTWCGDSKREVPRFYKLLHVISFPIQQVKLIALGGDSLVKQSPQHEEKKKGIFRVPTFIVYKNGVEVSRINEYPAFSLEKTYSAF